MSSATEALNEKPVEAKADASVSASEKIPEVKDSTDYTVLFEKIKDKSCRVIHIDQQLEGFNNSRFRTRTQLIETELERIYEAKTLSEIHEAIEKTGRNLSHLDVFRNIDFLVYEEPVNEPESCTVEMRLEEKNWYKIHAATYVQGGENSMEVGLGIHNATGGAEHLFVSYEQGFQKSSTVSAVLEQPRPAGLPVSLEIRGHQLLRNEQRYSSVTEQLRGGVVTVRSMDDRHAVHYEGGWRSLSDPSGRACRSIRQQLGDSLRSVFGYRFLVNKRDNALLPTRGWALRLDSEVAGLVPQGAPRTLKQQAAFSAALPMNPEGNVVLHVGASGGVLLPWGKDYEQKTTSIADRFFVGGPGSLRGFLFKGVGPSEVRRPAAADSAAASEAPEFDRLGGDAFATLFASLAFQLPGTWAQRLRVHGQTFVNAANLAPLTGNDRSVRENAKAFFTNGSDWRLSTGFGVALPSALGRLEANYCVVLNHKQGDSIKHGFQIGFAASEFH
mmetsp:Transcript_14035/g.24605  ORF Transcript_14035/g.24605 Transcript_14035/m.24605 type:complete len:501 (+) Transcript_14035:55-1557(+)